MSKKKKKNSKYPQIRQPTCSIVSLGCPKNLIDSEIMIAKMIDAGFLFQKNPDLPTDVMILNTCGFLHEARSEAREILELLIQSKKSGQIKTLVVAGCAVQIERQKLEENFPEVNHWLGVNEELMLSAFVAQNAKRKAQSKESEIQNKENNVQNKAETAKICSDNLFVFSNSASNNNETLCALRSELCAPARYQLTFPHVAYLKIAEGCSRRCAYCLIPKIRGKYQSRSKIEILDEAKYLADNGTREIIVIAQETSFWGIDTNGKPQLTELLADLQEIDGVEWIRLMYTYPAYFSDDLIDLFAAGGKLLPYLDMPLQHSHDTILKAMNRSVSRGETEELLAKLRERIPQLVMRTSLIVGFPGETDEMFGDLLEFTAKQRFERAGVFRYSREEGTPAAEMPNQISEGVKEDRYLRLHGLTKRLTREWANRQIGKRLKVIIDQPMHDERGRLLRGVWVGRTFADAPTVDPVVIVTEQNNAEFGMRNSELKGTNSKRRNNSTFRIPHSELQGQIVECEIAAADDINLIAVK
jgi:ribosomal protein S12 methylthiotransferase